MTERGKVRKETFLLLTLRRNEEDEEKRKIPEGNFQNILTLCVSICIEYTAKVPVNKCQV